VKFEHRQSPFSVGEVARINHSLCSCQGAWFSQCPAPMSWCTAPRILTLWPILSETHCSLSVRLELRMLWDQYA